MFTVSQIAAALGASRQSVHQALFSVVPVQGKQLMRGSEANAWTFAVLPSSMQAKLQRRAKAKGYRNAEHLLADPPRRFESPVPVGQLAGPIQQRAMKLREAMARPLAEFASGMKGGALEEIGLRQYQRVFGFEITSRHWRTLFQRTLDRDAGEEQWDRLDLYLDANPRGRAKAARLHSAERDAETLLLSYASQIRQPGVPTDDEKVMLWQTAFEQMEELGQSGVPLKKARKLMRRALWKCGAMLAKTESALACAWIRKEEAWRAADGNIAALKDRRAISSGNFRSPDIPQNDVDLVIGYAVKFNGRVSQAWRHVLENRMLSADIQSHYEGLFPASKSYVPRVIRNAVRHEVREMRNIHHGPRTADLNGAYITRKWDDVAAGDWYQADDVTLNNYYYAPDGNGGWTLIRGQVLLMIDVRSMCILSFAILDQRNY
ncbi:MAG TPA: hypothetical protein VL981_06255, partial [Candidatus Methylacidiphilales bacterium]|nr:hypothetical protein [Candidatus Methylacidiphilales bacterium]